MTYEVAYPSTPVGSATASSNRNNDFLNQARFSQSCSSNSAWIVVVRDSRCGKFTGRTSLFLSHGRSEKYDVVYPSPQVGSVTASSNRNNDLLSQLRCSQSCSSNSAEIVVVRDNRCDKLKVVHYSFCPVVEMGNMRSYTN